MTTKVNIFSNLPVHSDDEEDFDQQNDSKPKEKRVRNRGKKTDAPEQVEVVSGKTDSKARDHNLKKAGNDLDHPHRLDRKSGTGQSAFDKKDKKQGAGKGNWGSLKDDRRAPREEGEEPVAEVEAEETEDKTITLEEYLGKNSSSQRQQQVNEAKAKITEEQLKKDLGKATQLQNRKVNKVDDHQETYKKTNENTILGMNTEHASLLGFRTGFKTFDAEKRERRDNRDGDRERKPRGPRTEQKTDATEEQTAEKTEEGAEQTAEQTTEQTGEKTEQKEGEVESPSGNQRRGGYKGNNPRGGYRRDNREGGDAEGTQRRGGYRGNNNRGENREGGEVEGTQRRGGYRGGYKGENREGGDVEGTQRRGGYKGGYKGENREGDNNTEGARPQGNRGGYKGGNSNYNRSNKGESKGFNAEDESSFPKLG